VTGVLSINSEPLLNKTRTNVGNVKISMLKDFGNLDGTNLKEIKHKLELRGVIEIQKKESRHSLGVMWC